MLFFSFVLPALPDSREKKQDEQLSEMYFNNALTAMKGGDNALSLEMLNLSISFNKDLSDTRYLKALILTKAGNTDRAQKELKIAFLLGNWKTYSDFNGRVLYAEILRRRGEFEKAYRELLPFRDKIGGDKKAAEVFALSAALTGRIDVAVNTAKLFPLSNFAQIILARYDTGWRHAAAVRILKGDPVSYYTKDALQEIILHSSDEGAGWMLRYYKDRWGEDRFYLINSIINDDSNLEKRIVTVLKMDETINRADLLRIGCLLDKKGIKYNAAAFFQDKKITINEDINNDGIVDGRTVLDSGSITDTILDADQDGMIDYEIVSPGGKIERILIDNGEKSIDARYNPYPYLAEYTVILEGKKRTYYLLPYKAAYPVVKEPKSPFKGRMSLNVLLKELSPLFLESVSSKVEEVQLQGNERLTAERESLSDTTLEYTNKNGRVYRKREYKGREVVEEEKDLDGDGIPDLYYRYKGGVLQSASFDRNHNGFPEYMEKYSPVIMTEWDFDDNGSFDYREYTAGDKLIREYSTNMDGNFDLRIEESAGNLENGSPE